jgi:hypothetical protein
MPQVERRSLQQHTPQRDLGAQHPPRHAPHASTPPRQLPIQVLPILTPWTLQSQALDAGLSTFNQTGALIIPLPADPEATIDTVASELAASFNLLQSAGWIVDPAAVADITIAGGLFEIAYLVTPVVQQYGWFDIQRHYRAFISAYDR